MDIDLIKNKGNTKSIRIGKDIYIDRNNFTIIAGPCAVENERQIYNIAEFLSKLGIKILRGGAFKPRTSPYSFQGLGFDGLKLLRNVADAFDMKVVSEIMDPRDVEKAYNYLDIYQIGSRNMHNFSLLKEIGKVDKPVLLKRGMSSTVEEWILAAEYIALEGNENIILCERGIRTFENYTRNTLDISAVPIVKSLTNLPVIVDPSHGTGRVELINPMVKASLVAGAEGAMVEIHPCPKEALSDGIQSLDFEGFKKLVNDIKLLQSYVREIR